MVLNQSQHGVLKKEALEDYKNMIVVALLADNIGHFFRA